MYTLNQITMTSLLGGPLVGVYFVYNNYSALEMKENAVRFLVIGCVVSVLALSATIYLPENAPGVVYAGILVGILRGVASHLQGSLIQGKLEEGVPIASNWRCFGLGLVFLIGSFVGLMALVMLLDPMGLLPSWWYEGA